MIRNKEKSAIRRGKYRVYTEGERQAAAAYGRMHGAAAASRKYGFPAATIRNWMEAGGQRLASEDGRYHLGGLGREQNADSDIWMDEIQQSDLTGQGVRIGARSSKGTATRHVARKYTPSQIRQVLDDVRVLGVTETGRKYGVSRSAIYDWKRREARAEAGQGASPAEGPDPNEIETQRDQEILNEWHRQPGLGPSQIRNQLRRKGVKVAVQTVRRVMEDHGYRPPKVRRKRHDERFEAVRPNQLWHFDFMHRHINRASTFTLIVLDDYSRFVVGHAVGDAERAELVTTTFREAVERHGRPEMVLHDKGSAFWSWRGISRFTALLTEMGIDQVVAEHKEWNGKLEVFNGNLHKELFDVQRFHSLDQMRRQLAAHLHWYNYHRTSHALGGLLVPADRYHGRATEVLEAIETGRQEPQIGEPVPVAHRLLDILRVTSTGGQAQVYLMGQRIWPQPK